VVARKNYPKLARDSSLPTNPDKPRQRNPDTEPGQPDTEPGHRTRTQFRIKKLDILLTKISSY
jgi:hypothetical protein